MYFSLMLLATANASLDLHQRGEAILDEVAIRKFGESCMAHETIPSLRALGAMLRCGALAMPAKAAPGQVILDRRQRNGACRPRSEKAWHA